MFFLYCHVREYKIKTCLLYRLRGYSIYSTLHSIQYIAQCTVHCKLYNVHSEYSIPVYWTKYLNICMKKCNNEITVILALILVSPFVYIHSVGTLRVLSVGTVRVLSVGTVRVLSVGTVRVPSVGTVRVLSVGTLRILSVGTVCGYSPGIVCRYCPGTVCGYCPSTICGYSPDTVCRYRLWVLSGYCL